MKDRYKIIFGIFIGIMLNTVSAFAISQIYSKDVTYDNSVTKLSSTDVQGALDELYSEATDYSAVRQELNEIKNKLYPVGSIYISTTLTSASQVQNILGGTWEAYGSGRTLVGVNTSDGDFNTVGKTGGEKTHTLTTAEMPSHYHGENIAVQGYSGWTKQTISYYSVAINYAAGGNYQSPGTSLNMATVGTNASTTSTGGGGAHNILQPYITVYMYKRTN